MAGNIKIGQFYSINRFRSILDKYGLCEKLFGSRSNREKVFRFFYGTDFYEHFSSELEGNGGNNKRGNLGNQILTGVAKEGNGYLVGWNLENVSDMEKYSRRIQEIVMFIKDSGIELSTFKDVLDEFLGISFISNSACKNIKDQTRDKRKKLEEFRNKVISDTSCESNVVANEEAFHQFCDKYKNKLPDGISASILSQWAERINAELALARVDQTMSPQEKNVRIRTLSRKLEQIGERIEDNSQNRNESIENAFPKEAKKLVSDLEVMVTGYHYFDMIINSDAVYKLSHVELDKEVCENHILPSEILDGIVCRKEEELQNIEKTFRTLEIKEKLCVIHNPDYLDICALLNYVSENKEMQFKMDIRKIGDNKAVVCCITSRNAENIQLKGTDLYENAKKHYGVYRQKYESLSRESLEKAVANACTCIACCSAVRSAIEKIFPDVWLEIVKEFSYGNMKMVKSLILSTGWKYEDEEEVHAKHACIFYICGKLMDEFTEEEKKELSIKDKKKIDLYNRFYEVYCKYYKSNEEKVKEFHLSSCWSMFIGLACIEIIEDEMKSVFDTEKVKKLLKIAEAEKDELSRQNAYLLHGRFCETGIVYEKDELKAFEYYLKSGMNEGLSNAAILLKSIEEEGRYEDFSKLWEIQHARMIDPIEELCRNYNCANADIYQIYLRQKEEEECKEANEEIEKLSEILMNDLREHEEEKNVISRKQIVIFGWSEKTKVYLSSLNTNLNIDVYIVDKDLSWAQKEEIKWKYAFVRDCGKDIEQYITGGKIILYNLRKVCMTLCSSLLDIHQLFSKNRLHYLFLSDDKNENLEYAIKVFELTKNFQRKYDALLQQIESNNPSKVYSLNGSFRLSEFIDLTVDVESDDRELYIDSIQRDTMGFYLPIRYINYDDEIARSLLYHQPLFLPLLNPNRKKEENLSVVLLGNDKSMISMIKAIVSLGSFTDIRKCAGCQDDIIKVLYNSRIKLIVVDRNAKELESKLKFEAPELFADENYGICKPEFYNMDLFGGEFVDLFISKNKDGKGCDLSIGNAVSKADYYICAMDNDRLSVKLAQKIRTLLYSCAETYEYRPIVSALCRDTIYAERNNKISVGDNMIKGLWYADYQVYLYGTIGEIYSSANLHDNYIQQLALKIHCSYYKGGWKERDDAKNDYYCSAYNRDSSITAALYSIYRCYSAGMYSGIDMLQWCTENVCKNKSTVTLTERVSDKNYDTIIEKLAIQEHIRWCGQMISRAWRPATKEQIENYLKAGAKKHMLHVGKIHPYLYNWNKLGERNLKKEDFSDILADYDRLTGNQNAEEKVSVIYLSRKVIRPCLEELRDCYRGTNNFVQVEKKADVLGEIKEIRNLRTEIEEVKESCEENSGENISICEEIILIVEKVIEWIKVYEVFINIVQEEEYYKDMKSFYTKCETFMEDLQKKTQNLEQYLKRPEYQGTKYINNKYFNPIASYFTTVTTSHRKFANTVEELSAAFMKLISAFRKIISSSKGDGIQHVTDELLWQYIPDRVSRLSIRETNRQMVKDSFELYRELALEHHSPEQEQSR